MTILSEVPSHVSTGVRMGATGLTEVVMGFNLFGVDFWQVRSDHTFFVAVSIRSPRVV
jgi:hypothetical protein